MNPGSQRGIRLAVGAAALVSLLGLTLALVWLNLSPLVVLVLALGGIAVVIMVLRPEVGLHVFLLLMLVENYGEADKSISVSKLLGLVILGAWFLNVTISRNLRIPRSRFIILMLAFLGWSALSISAASNGDVAVRQTLTFAQLLVATLMFGSVADTPERLTRVLRSLVVFITLAATHGLYQYAFGHASTTAGVVLNRNLMATYITVAIACAYLLYQASRSGFERLALLAVLPVLFVGLALTFSRGGLIGLAVIVVFLAYRLARRGAYLFLGATTAMVLFVSIWLPGAFYERVESIAPVVRRQADTFGQRIELVKAGVRMIAAHPITGVGAGNFPSSLHRYGRGAYVMAAEMSSHNTYVGLAAESGLPAAVLFVLAIVMAIRSLRRTARGIGEGDSTLPFVAMAIELSMIAVMIGGLSGNLEKTKLLYILLGLALGLEELRRAGAAAAPLLGEGVVVAHPPLPATR